MNRDTGQPARPIPGHVLPTDAGYDLWAAIYDDEDNPLIRLEQRHLDPLLGDVAGLDVLELGCGTGRRTLPLAAAGARVTALDFSAGMVGRAAAKPGWESIRFIRHDLERPLPLPDAAFDRVFSFLVLDHIAGLDGFFAEAARVCRPAGRIVCSVMHPAMMLVGVQARFTDPATGGYIRPASSPNRLSDYVMAATRAGLRFEHLSERAVDEPLAAASPRAAKYLGWPLLLLIELRYAG